MLAVRANLHFVSRLPHLVKYLAYFSQQNEVFAILPPLGSFYHIWKCCPDGYSCAGQWRVDCFLSSLGSFEGKGVGGRGCTLYICGVQVQLA